MGYPAHQSAWPETGVALGATVKNADAGTILRGNLVRFHSLSTAGDTAKVARSASSEQFPVGIAIEDIAPGGSGRIALAGIVSCLVTGTVYDTDLLRSAAAVGYAQAHTTGSIRNWRADRAAFGYAIGNSVTSVHRMIRCLLVPWRM